MAQEIERKFLVKGDFKPEAYQSIRITQGYLSSVPERTVRVRIKGEQGFLTIKGKGNHSGISRYEWEKEITLNEAEELLQLCEPGVIENEGLVMAEIELETENENFTKPAWLDKEVTGDNRYYNAMLTKYPYTKW